MIDADLKVIEKGLCTWYNADEKSSLDLAVSAYTGALTFVKQLCISIKEGSWSILDISVLCDVHSPDNGYVQKT